MKFVGFGDRLVSEIKKGAPKDVKIKVRDFSLFDHGYVMFLFISFFKFWNSKLFA